jgi:hypothetical protein
MVLGLALLLGGWREANERGGAAAAFASSRSGCAVCAVYRLRRLVMTTLSLASLLSSKKTLELGLGDAGNHA